ncbi:hypothetical protein D3C87_1243760 [compost metagenome]
METTGSFLSLNSSRALVITSPVKTGPLSTPAGLIAYKERMFGVLASGFTDHNNLKFPGIMDLTSGLFKKAFTLAVSLSSALPTIAPGIKAIC